MHAGLLVQKGPVCFAFQSNPPAEVRVHEGAGAGHPALAVLHAVHVEGAPGAERLLTAGGRFRGLRVGSAEAGEGAGHEHERGDPCTELHYLVTCTVRLATWT